MQGCYTKSDLKKGKRSNHLDIKIMRKGFTLIEILIVVAIIAILASIVLVGLGPAQQSGRDARRLSDLHEVQNALELYYNKCGSYPGGATCGSSVAAAKYPSTNSASTEYGGMANAIIGAGLTINSMPQDPTAGASYYYAIPATTGATTYVLGAKLENPNNSAFTNYNPPTVPGSYTGDTAGLNGCPVAGPQYCVSL